LGYDRKQRRGMARKGQAVPITNDVGEILDGSLPIQTRGDLLAAIEIYPGLKDKRAAKVHIVRLAEEIGEAEALPESWKPRPKRPRGRPPGSSSLTRERYEKIIGLIRAGVFDYVAAEVAGVSSRALREWVARGEGRSKRPTSPKCRAFAKDFRQAKAEARALLEAKVYRDFPKWWLSHSAPSRKDRPGWTENGSEEDPGEHSASTEGLADLITGVRNDRLYIDPETLVPSCLNRRCRCCFHRERTPEEAERLREMADCRRTEPGGER